MHRLVKNFLTWVFLRIDGLVLKSSPSTSQSGVALIRLDAIGDFVIWLDAAKEFRRLYPDQKITLVANAAWADLAQQLPYWDAVFSVNVRDLSLRQPLRRWQLLRHISKGGFHIAVQPTCSRVLMHGDSVIRASGARERIGSMGDLANASAAERNTGNRWYTQLLPASPKPMMELLRNAEFVSHLAGATYQACLPELPRLAALPEALQPAMPYFIVFPGASWAGRQWPVQHFVEVLMALQGHYGWQPVLCGGSNEVALCEAIANASSANCLNLAGQTSLVALAEVIRSATLLVGNETSAVHLAAAVATPAVCILGGGHFGRFMPYPETVPGLKPVVAAEPMPCFHCNWRCNQPHDRTGPVPCIGNISVAVVLAAAQQALTEATDHALTSHITDSRCT